MTGIAHREASAGPAVVPRSLGVWSQRRIGVALVLAGWAVLFWFLLLAGRVDLFLSTRTSWVVPMAAILLTVAAAAVLMAGRVSRPEPVRLPEALGVAALLVPVVVLIALPPTSLGSFSAGKRTQFSGAAFSTVFGRFEADSEITLLMVAAAKHTPEGAALLAERAGDQVRLVGFVDRDENGPTDEFRLTRYIVTCCAADAAVVQARVVNVMPDTAAADDWVEVTGRIYPVGPEVVIVASSVRRVPQPARPYLTAPA
jgi:uncharacterized repeat protein (TIGR03943 family)